MKYNEDTLVQETTANYLRDQLSWESVYAYSEEKFGKEGTLGRRDETEVVLTRYLGEALIKLNPGLPQEAYQAAIREITQPTISQTLLHANREKYNLLREGVLVSYQDEKGTLKKARLRVFDFQNPEANHFLCVRELWIKGALYRRRADIVGFVNGLPLIFIELKNIHRDLRRAYEQNLSDYKDTIPHLFEHNAVIVLGNGTTAKIGSLSSRYKHFREWKRLAEEELGAVDMETLLKGICSKANFIDLFENFILFDESKETLLKIVAQNQQFLGVNLAIDAVKNRESLDGKLGVFWHTQGAGKSYSIVFFARKVHRQIGGNFTFLVLTDREDLDGQIYGTFAGCGVVNNDKDPCRAGSGAELKAMLAEAHKHFVFSLIQKFNQPVTPENPYSTRGDIIVITDEAHRTQYGTLSLNMRNALPKASYIGFTGTPLFSSDEITRRVFGNYVSRYGFQRAVEDGATVPLYYDARGEKLGVAVNDLNERIAAKLEELEQNGELEDINVTERLEKELKRDYHVITAGPRLEKIAKDFVEHYSTEWESGKAVLVAIDKITAVRMHQIIEKYWKEKIEELRKATALLSDEQELTAARRRIGWMEETTIAVVISEEQGEVKKFRHWDIDIEPYRKLLKTGFPDVGGKSLSVEDAFKKEGHPFRVAIVCAMWLTGFDVPCLSTLYLDKPLQAHTLMQAIARANRVHEGKNNGLIIDYCGILKNLRKALATFAGSKGGENDGEVNPLQPSEDLLPALASAIGLVYDFLRDKGAELEAVINSSGFERNAAIDRAKNAINENDETRKRFEIVAREVFSKFKACITLPAINDYRAAEGGISIIYKSLQEDRDAADISHIIQQLHAVIEPAIAVKPESLGGGRLYDISAIDFDLLRREFERLPNKQTAAHNLKDAIEKRLARMLAQNPLRTNFQKRYEEIVAEYNGEKDRVTIETTFEALMRFMGNLDEEAESTIREGLNEETKALFDLLKKKDLEKKDIDRIKKVAVELHAILLRKKAEIDEWRAKEQTRDEVRTTIRDFLYADSTGLPDSYTDQEVVEKTDAVFAWAYRAYA